MNPENDYIIENGVKLWRSTCKLCGKEFFDVNPYRKNCKDKEIHKAITRHNSAQKSWSKINGHSYSLGDNWSGSWDNSVNAIEK